MNENVYYVNPEDEYPVQDISEDDKIEFIRNSLLLDNIALTRDQIKDAIYISTKRNSHVTGVQRCLNLLCEEAKNFHLLPPSHKISMPKLFQQFSWLIRFHKNIFAELANTDTIASTPLPHQLGNLREDNSYLHNIPTINPIHIKSSLFKQLQLISNINQQTKELRLNPRLLEQEDYQLLANTAYDFGIFITASQPFLHGSEQIARLSENLLRLHWLLPIKLDYNRFEYITHTKKKLKELVLDPHS